MIEGVFIADNLADFVINRVEIVDGAVLCVYKVIDVSDECFKEIEEKGAEAFYEEAVSIASNVEAAGAAMISKGSEFLDEREQWLGSIGKDFGNMFGFGGGYSSNSGTYIKVDTNKLRDYATEMEMLRRQANDIERRINDLYFKTGLKRRVENIAEGVDRDFRGIGERECSSGISSMVQACQYIQNEISEID